MFVCVVNLIFFGLLFAKSFSEELGNIFCRDTCTLSAISSICFAVCVHNTGNDCELRLLNSLSDEDICTLHGNMT